jgi:hypothetical protein
MALGGRWRQVLRSADGRATVRRRTSMALDRRWATAWKRIRPRRSGLELEGDPRLALLTVNFSTTRYLKLMLLTLSTQERLDLLHRIVVVDNGSQDGGAGFLVRLQDRVPRLEVVLRRHRLSHGVGMRAAVRALDRADRDAAQPATHLLFCDTDVVFRAPDALATVAEAARTTGAALVGEVRTGANAQPDIQASFFLVRRDVLARRDIGAPAYRMQRSIWEAGLPVVNLPTNHGGLILHRGRAGVEAATRLHPRHEYARVPTTAAHYMGVPDGARIWAAIEAEHSRLLDPAQEPELLDVLAERLAVAGASPPWS